MSKIAWLAIAITILIVFGITCIAVYGLAPRRQGGTRRVALLLGLLLLALGALLQFGVYFVDG